MGQNLVGSRKIRARNAIILDLQRSLRSFRAAGVNKRYLPLLKPGRRYGDDGIAQTLEDLHARIPKAITLARRGKLTYPAFLLGQVTALTNALGDERYIRWRAAQLNKQNPA